MSDDVVARLLLSHKFGPNGSIFSPESLQEIRDRLAHIEASECDCDESPHLDALHDVARDDVPVLLALVDQLAGEVDRLRREQVEFTARLGFGDNISEPAATLADMVDPIEAAFSDARDHQECPRICELCGEKLADTPCPECHGSGCDAPMCEVYGAYTECEHCAGAGWVHEGCAGVGYKDLAAEVERLQAVTA